MRVHVFALAALAAGLILACGSPPGTGEPVVETPEAFGLELNVSAGSYTDGSGRLGLAVLAALRDENGAGPETPWNVSVHDAHGALVATGVYPAGGTGSHAALWWPDVAFTAGTRLWLCAVDGTGKQLERSFILPAPGGLAVPTLSLGSDGSVLSWSDVAAAAYVCEATQDGALQHSETSTQTHCDLSALPQGSYLARVRAFSFAPEALAKQAAQSPSLPERFDVAEAAVGFSTASGGSVLSLQAAGGAIRFSSSGRGLAVWLSLQDASGAPLTAAAPVEVFGGAVSPDAPLRFEYPAGQGRQLVWAYDVPATSTQYTISATVGGSKVTTRFSVGDVSELALPQAAEVLPSTSGGATVRFPAGAGARSYYVGVWRHETGAFHTGRWVTASPVDFATQTFTRGEMYDVYVAATDVDMTANGPAPSAVSVSEDSYHPATFTSP